MATTGIVVTDVGGFTVNGSTGYRFVFDPRDAGGSPYTGSPQLRERQGDVPAREGVTYGARSVPFKIFNVGVAGDVFVSTVLSSLNPRKGPMVVTGLHPNESTVLTMTADAVDLKQVEHNQATGVLQFADPTWRATTPTTATTSPVTNAGNWNAQPAITLTPDNTKPCGHLSFTVADVMGSGQSVFPIWKVFNSTGRGATAPENHHLFADGQAIPFNVYRLNATDTILAFRPNLPHGGIAKQFDHFFGSNVNNQITANTLPADGLVWDHANFSNVNWVGDVGWLAVFDNPQIVGTWLPATLDVSVFAGQGGFTISDAPHRDLDGTIITPTVNWPGNLEAIFGAPPVLVIQVGADVSARDANAITMVTSVPCLSLTGFIRQPHIRGLTTLPSVFLQQMAGYWRYQQPGSDRWLTAEILTSDPDPSDPLNPLDTVITFPGGARQIALSATIKNWPLATLMLGLTLNTVGSVQLDPAYVPVVSAGTITTAAVLSGALTNTTAGNGDTLTCSAYIDGPVTIDCLTKQITGNRWPASGSKDFTVSNGPLWFTLAPGANTLTGPAGASWSLAFKAAYLV
jgi:hypothetical protein